MASDEELLGALADARALGFLGPGPVERHLEHALAFAAAIAGAKGRGLDLGSGGGVPGLVLAARLPDWTWTLLDAARRRTSFLVAKVAALDLAGRVHVVRGRADVLAEDPSHREAYDLVTARSFGTPAVTSEAARPFLRQGGRLVVSEPPGAPDRWDDAALHALGLRSVSATTAPFALRTFERFT
jgi:16S rRNA (guanine527-N7)-methyltransferase